MLDSSTTASFLIPFIAKYKGITLFTNNMETALSAVANGITTHCSGGKSFNNSPVLVGRDAERSIANIYTDILFFSSQSIDKNGVISDSCEEETHLRALMLEKANKKIFLCDKEKVNQISLHTLTKLENLDACVLEEKWSELVCDNCKIIY